MLRRPRGSADIPILSQIRADRSRQDIITLVSFASAVSRNDLTGPNRTKRVSFARYVAYYVMRQRGFSFTQIGAVFGGRDHTSVMHGVRAVEADLAGGFTPERSNFLELLNDVEAMLDGRKPIRRKVAIVGEPKQPEPEPEPVPEPPRSKRPAKQIVEPKIPSHILDRARKMRRFGGTLKGTAKALHVDPLSLALALGEAIRNDMVPTTKDDGHGT